MPRRIKVGLHPTPRLFGTNVPVFNAEMCAPHPRLFLERSAPVLRRGFAPRPTDFLLCQKKVSKERTAKGEIKKPHVEYLSLCNPSLTRLRNAVSPARAIFAVGKYG